MNEIQLHINDGELDEALEKANRLKRLLEEIRDLIHSLSGIT